MQCNFSCVHVSDLYLFIYFMYQKLYTKIRLNMLHLIRLNYAPVNKSSISILINYNVNNSEIFIHT